MTAEATIEATASPSVGTQAAISAGWMIAWRFVTRVLGLVSTLILARLLTPGDFGLIAMGTSFVAAVDSLSGLGILDALVRRRSNDRHMLDTAFTLQLVRGFVTACIIAATAIPVRDWFGEPRLLTIMLILGALSAASGFENIGIAEFRHQLRFDREFKLLFLPRIMSFAVTVGCAVAFRSYWALVAGVVTSKLCRLVMTYVAHPYRPRLSLRSWNELAGFSFWNWASSLAYLVWDRADYFVYGPVLGASTLGVYMLAAEIALLPITELVSPASAALFPGVARAQDQGQDVIALAVPIALTLALLTVPLAIGISATSGYVVASLLGPQWDATRPLIAIFSLTSLFSPFSFVCMTVLVARGHIRRSFFGITAASTTKVIVLAIMSSVTREATLFAWAGVGITAVEAICFLVQLNMTQRIDWLSSLRPAGRILASSLATMVVLYATGAGWQPTQLVGMSALGVGVAIGLSSLAFFGLVQIMLWWLDGRPEGPEKRLVQTALPLIRRLRQRFA